MVRKSKLLSIFQITIFLLGLFVIGCERQDGNTIQTQTTNLIPEDAVVNEIEYEEIAQQMPLDPVRLTLINDPTSFDRTVYVDRNVTRILFSTSHMTGIEGLEQLEFLETIAFVRLVNLNDFSFLAQVPQLKNLYFIDTGDETHFSFIEHLPNLEVLHADNSHRSHLFMDLRNNRYLEFIGFMFSRLETFPVLLNAPDTLRYLSLEGNRITALPDDFDNIPSNTTVILSFNPFEINEATPSNVTTEDFGMLVTEERFIGPPYTPAFIFGARMP